MQVYYFPGSDYASVSDVGGKAFSLINMCQGGMSVPPGMVLSVGFFEPWIWQLKQTEHWQSFKKSKAQNIDEASAQFQKVASGFSFNEEQRMCLDELYAFFSKDCAESSFAVRSSSPEEDLDNASFAGGYDTILGVSLEGLESAILKIFCSCLDKRVFLYKQERGFNIFDPKIAVIIQEQIDSDVAGVAFSINPMTNNYDEVVINANWGLGESVVSGQVSPDQFVTNKFAGSVLDRTIGAKEIKVALAQKGGTEECKSSDTSSFSLSDEQVKEITLITAEVESLYEAPVDVEWAISRNKLYLLQARPITTYVPLPSGMITEPGEAKQLYLDVSLCVQGIHRPLSIMGLDWLKQLFEVFSKEVFGVNLVENENVKESLVICDGGRLYANLTNILRILGKERFCHFFQRMDKLAVDIISNINEDDYLNFDLPPKLQHVKTRVISHIPDTIAKILGGTIVPGMIKKNYERAIREFQHIIDHDSKTDMPIEDFLEISLKQIIELIVHFAVPVIASSERAKEKIKKQFSNETEQIQKKVANLDRSLPGNVTVEMGLELFHMASYLDKSIKSLEELKDLIFEEKVPLAFQPAWDHFIDTYGFRGPVELDLASTRYKDNSDMLLEQVFHYIAIGEKGKNPNSIYEKCQHDRHEAFEELMEIAHKKGWLASVNFQRLFRTIEILGGLRETHKYHLIKVNYIFREKVLAEAEKMVASGRLQNVNDVFKLTIKDFLDVLENPKMDLQKCLFERTEYLNQLNKVQDFPAVIDSRGKILQPKPRQCQENEVCGQGVSMGVARGIVRVLNSPDEKPILPGEILVTKATDPGWTPLFINAGAIVLEVGGVLQHGALVAREYGKPCVVGIPNVMSVLKDGQVVEVDGTNGIVRILE